MQMFAEKKACYPQSIAQPFVEDHVEPVKFRDLQPNVFLQRIMPRQYQVRPCPGPWKCSRSMCDRRL